MARQVYEVPKAGGRYCYCCPGYPKDVDLYQATRAVTPAFGTKTFGETKRCADNTAVCPDGIGHEGYHAWMKTVNWLMRP